ncbi:LysR substrate-binding domain-containing protein [Paraburkholderia strydomiana]|uniref:LysR substrate-binding domain-containing protein n=1 Tax=Paraburkholderia strydomiana TaxID=1245417 RepID=UPI00285B8B02|nr:LysR substrate-binding domain-containing protein [Paraburkholderia strydomiana]MDR7009298.1 DNA-binding transcriptional LysR family regulator [Paraburkholderia strydomiana]
MKTTGLLELNAVVALASHRNFRLAAQDLGVSRSTLSHLIASLETRIGVRLFNRTTRSVALSEAGEAFLERVRPALADISLAIEAANGFRASPKGTLRIATCEAGARSIIGSVVTPFLQTYPDMTVDVVTEGRILDIVAEGFDAGLQAPEDVPLDMIALPCGQPRRQAVVASPRYLRGRSAPVHPFDLSVHRCIRRRVSGAGLQQWVFERSDERLTIPVQGPLVLDNRNAVIEAAVDGVGLAYVNHELAAPYLASGRLVELLVEWVPALPRLSFFYPGRRHLPAGLVAFINLVRASANADQLNAHGGGVPKRRTASDVDPLENGIAHIDGAGQ